MTTSLLPSQLVSLSGGSRAGRRAAAEERRKAWRLRWVEIAREGYQQGKRVVECVHMVGVDADKIIKETPQFKSEVLRAVDEFSDRLRSSIDRANEKVIAATFFQP